MIKFIIYSLILTVSILITDSSPTWIKCFDSNGFATPTARQYTAITAANIDRDLTNDELTKLNNDYAHLQTATKHTNDNKLIIDRLDYLYSVHLQLVIHLLIII